MQASCTPSVRKIGASECGASWGHATTAYRLIPSNTHEGLYTMIMVKITSLIWATVYNT